MTKGEIEKMFSYYGSKSKIVQYYPRPTTHDKIIEPFAGSARYSLRYWEKDILLVDKYKVIVDIWHYLQEASEKDILGLPRLKYNEDLRDFNLSEIEINFLLYNYQQGTVGGYKCSKWGERDGYENILKISKNLYKIKHWKIIQGSYEDLENENATWFIDPPYFRGGHKYKESNKKINFQELSNWCKSRNGQVIVCENTDAKWMEFKPIININGVNNTKSTEAIWTNFPTQYDSIQMEFFKEASYQGKMS